LMNVYLVFFQCVAIDQNIIYVCQAENIEKVL